MPINKYIISYDCFCITTLNNEIIIHSQNYLEKLISDNIDFIYKYIVNNIKYIEKELNIIYLQL